MVSEARWLSVLPAGRRPGGLPISASAPGRPLLPAAWARPVPCYGSLLTPRALGPARPLLPAPSPLSGVRPVLGTPASLLPEPLLTLALPSHSHFRRGFLFPSLDSSDQACNALPSRAQAEGDGGGKESETSWGPFGLRNLAQGSGGGSQHPLPKLWLCGCRDRPLRTGVLGVPSTLRLCGIRGLFSGPLWCQASWTKGFLPCSEGCLYSKALGTLNSIPQQKETITLPFGK